MKGEGAIVFLIVFIVLLAATLASASLPPGRDLYGLLGVPETNYPVLGVPTTVLVSAISNGVIYGIIFWLIFTLFRRTTKKEKTITNLISLNEATIFLPLGNNSLNYMIECSDSEQGVYPKS